MVSFGKGMCKEQSGLECQHHAPDPQSLGSVHCPDHKTKTAHCFWSTQLWTETVPLILLRPSSSFFPNLGFLSHETRSFFKNYSA